MIYFHDLFLVMKYVIYMFMGFSVPNHPAIGYMNGNPSGEASDLLEPSTRPPHPRSFGFHPRTSAANTLTNAWMILMMMRMIPGQLIPCRSWDPRHLCPRRWLHSLDPSMTVRCSGWTSNLLNGRCIKHLLSHFQDRWKMWLNPWKHNSWLRRRPRKSRPPFENLQKMELEKKMHRNFLTMQLVNQ